MEQARENSPDLSETTRARDVGMGLRYIGDQIYHEQYHINQERKRSRANNIFKSLVPYLGMIAANIYKAFLIF